EAEEQAGKIAEGQARRQAEGSTRTATHIGASPPTWAPLASRMRPYERPEPSHPPRPHPTPEPYRRPDPVGKEEKTFVTRAWGGRSSRFRWILMATSLMLLTAVVAVPVVLLTSRARTSVNPSPPASMNPTGTSSIPPTPALSPLTNASGRVPTTAELQGALLQQGTLPDGWKVTGRTGPNNQIEPPCNVLMSTHETVRALVEYG